MEDGRTVEGRHGAVESLVGHQVPDCSLEKADQAGREDSPQHSDPLLLVLLQLILSERGRGRGGVGGGRVVSHHIVVRQGQSETGQEWQQQQQCC